MNPILAREVRARWRDNRAFILLFVITSLLCLGVLWAYNNGLYSGRPYQFSSAWQQAANASREIFKTITYSNTVCCLLLATALSAPGIASERERGLLESVWLSQLKPRSLVIGRLFSTLAYLLTLQIAVLPAAGICLVLGSVGPGDLLLAFAIAATAGFTGTVVGIWASARSYRPTSALVTAFVTQTAWYLCTVGVIQSQGGGYQFVLCLHPMGAAYCLVEPNSASRFILSSLNDTTIWWGLAIQVLLAGLLLVLACIKAAKPLPPPRWMSAKNPRLEAWRHNLEHRKAEAQAQREKRLSQQVEGALLAEIPLAKFVNFKNPLLQREVRSRFRMRQVSRPLQMVRALIFLGAAGFWVATIMQAVWPETRASAGQSLIMGLGAGGVLAVAVLSSQSFTREREGGTWEGVRLSLLQAVEIVKAKWLAPLITCFYWALPLLILVPFCSDILSATAGGRNGLPASRAFAAMIMLVSWCGFTCALGLFYSWRCRTTAAATSWTLGTLAVLFFGLPQLMTLWLRWYYASLSTSMGTNTFAVPSGYSYEYYASSSWISWAYPLQIFARLTGNYPYGYYYGAGYYYETQFAGVAPHLFTLWVATFACLFLVRRMMLQEDRDTESIRDPGYLTLLREAVNL